jgi:hypothetical protein
MNEHEKQTAFLREIIRYEDTAEHKKLDDEIMRLQRQLHVLQRAVYWMTLLAALAIAGLSYAVVLSTDFPHNASRFFAQVCVKAPCALGLASLVSLLCFAGLGVAYRKELNGRREDARRLAGKFLASRLSKPATEI